MFKAALFTWLRRAVAEAVVAGFADALSAVTGREVDPSTALERLDESETPKDRRRAIKSR